MSLSSSSPIYITKDFIFTPKDETSSLRRDIYNYDQKEFNHIISIIKKLHEVGIRYYIGQTLSIENTFTEHLNNEELRNDNIKGCIFLSETTRVLRDIDISGIYEELLPGEMFTDFKEINFDKREYNILYYNIVRKGESYARRVARSTVDELTPVYVYLICNCSQEILRNIIPTGTLGDDDLEYDSCEVESCGSSYGCFSDGSSSS